MVQLSDQVIHDLTLLYLQRHPDLLSSNVIPENYASIYEKYFQRIKNGFLRP